MVLLGKAIFAWQMSKMGTTAAAQAAALEVHPRSTRPRRAERALWTTYPIRSVA